jgi:hypothetical protein
MFSPELPAVLTPNNGYSSLSLQRGLKQIKRLLEDIEPRDIEHEDTLNHSIDDVDVMLSCINYSGEFRNV